MVLVTVVSPCDWRSAGHVRPFGRPRPERRLRSGVSQLPGAPRIRLWQPHRLLPVAGPHRHEDAPPPRALLARAPRAVRPWRRQSPNARPAVPGGSVPRLPSRHDGLEEEPLLRRRLRCGDRRDRCLWDFSNRFSGGDIVELNRFVVVARGLMHRTGARRGSRRSGPSSQKRRPKAPVSSLDRPFRRAEGSLPIADRRGRTRHRR